MKAVGSECHLLRLSRAVNTAIGMHDPWATLLAVDLWRVLEGETLPPFDRTVAIRATVAAGLSLNETAQFWDVPNHLIVHLVKRP